MELLPAPPAPERLLDLLEMHEPLDPTRLPDLHEAWMALFARLLALARVGVPILERPDLFESFVAVFVARIPPAQRMAAVGALTSFSVFEVLARLGLLDDLAEGQ